MPTRVCDRSPCDRLSALAAMATMQVAESQIVFVVRTRNGASSSLAVSYCPFCGTRIGEDITERFLPIKG